MTRLLRSTSLPALLAVALSAVSPHPAAAQDQPSDRGPDSAMRWFDGIDRDKDGFMTAEEMTDVRDKRFDRTDGDGDGALSVDEYVFGIPASMTDVIEHRRKRFAAIDRDGDGSVTKPEYMAFGDQVMELADSDGDGRVSRKEFAGSVGGEGRP